MQHGSAVRKAIGELGGVSVLLSLLDFATPAVQLAALVRTKACVLPILRCSLQLCTLNNYHERLFSIASTFPLVISPLCFVACSVQDALKEAAKTEANRTLIAQEPNGIERLVALARGAVSSSVQRRAGTVLETLVRLPAFLSLCVYGCSLIRSRTRTLSPTTPNIELFLLRFFCLHWILSFCLVALHSSCTGGVGGVPAAGGPAAHARLIRRAAALGRPRRQRLRDGHPDAARSLRSLPRVPCACLKHRVSSSTIRLSLNLFSFCNSFVFRGEWMEFLTVTVSQHEFVLHRTLAARRWRSRVLPTSPGS